ncbi:hypothetical protein ACI6Q2_22450 [Chitinophagaceae bacterium LWZ2-11]
MNRQISILKELLGVKNNKKSYIEFDIHLSSFELENALLMPSDLVEYFKLIDNAANELSKDLSQFYTFDQFKSIKNELAHWGGVPDYRNIVNTLVQHENCFVFADYMSHLFAYAIRLYPNKTEVNEVYMICGDKHKIVANSFSGFLDLYFNNSLELVTI